MYFFKHVERYASFIALLEGDKCNERRHKRLYWLTCTICKVALSDDNWPPPLNSVSLLHRRDITNLKNMNWRNYQVSKNSKIVINLSLKLLLKIRSPIVLIKVKLEACIMSYAFVAPISFLDTWARGKALLRTANKTGYLC